MAAPGKRASRSMRSRNTKLPDTAATGDAAAANDRDLLTRATMYAAGEYRVPAQFCGYSRESLCERECECLPRPLRYADDSH